MTRGETDSDGRHAALLTGFPGVLGQHLLARLHQAAPNTEFFVLVPERLVFVAQRALRDLQVAHPALVDQWRVVVGDLPAPNLGVHGQHLATLRSCLTDVWHLAAADDPTISQSVTYAVNVTGTERVLDLCAGLPRLRRLHYLSTCYVAGRRSGGIYEDELDRGQDFNSHYESTKHWAELRVQAAWDQVPTTIYRPSTIVGDSQTGRTTEGTGPYGLIQLLSAIPRWVPTAHLGRSDASVNIVPIDFVVEAMTALSILPTAEHTVFALADPTPITARAFVELTRSALSTLPWRLRGVSGIRRALAAAAPSLASFAGRAQFDVSNTARLLEGQLLCPQVTDYWPTLVRYAAEHPELFTEAIA